MAKNTPTVLLLEDEPLIFMDIEAALKAEGFEVATVMSCLDANAWLDHCKPDLVVVDIELRDGTCTDVVIRLLKWHIPFVVHTGDHPSFYGGTPFAHGTWVGKPAATEELVQALKDAFFARKGEQLDSYA